MAAIHYNKEKAAVDLFDQAGIQSDLLKQKREMVHKNGFPTFFNDICGTYFMYKSLGGENMSDRTDFNKHIVKPLLAINGDITAQRQRQIF